MNRPQRTAAIVLAAGLSRRMGRLKALLPLGDRPVIVRVVDAIRQAGGIEPILVVTGHAREEVEGVLAAQPVLFQHNQDYAGGGMLSSIKAGLRALPADCEAFFVALGDQPLIRPSTLQALRDGLQGSACDLAIPVSAGRRGHPVLFSARCAAEILALPEDATLRTCIQSHASSTLEVVVEDPGILLDLDTAADYEQAVNAWNG